MNAAGPFGTEQQARETDAVQAVCEAFRADPGVGKMAPHNLAMLEQACAAAWVELGAFDRRVLAWLSGWEPQVCAVVAGLVTRAHAAGRAAGRPGIWQPTGRLTACGPTTGAPCAGLTPQSGCPAGSASGTGSEST